MELEILTLKGIHPGIILDRKMKEQGLRKSQLALSIREYPQTISSITKGRRDMNTALSLKLERALGLEEGYFMMLQVFYDIKKVQEKEIRKIDTTLFRPALFWDTDISKIDWEKQYKAIIHRVVTRGNKKEKRELERLYGKEKINQVVIELKKRKLE